MDIFINFMSSEQETNPKLTRAQRRKIKKNEEMRRIEKEIVESLEQLEKLELEEQEEEHWTMVSFQKKARQSKPVTKLLTSSNEDHLMNEDLDLFDKNFNKDLFNRQGDGRRRNVKESRKKKEHIVPHSDEDETDYVKIAEDTKPQEAPEDNDLENLLESARSMATEAPQEWISCLENVIIMAFQVSHSRSYREVFMAVMAYIKMNTNKSILFAIKDIIDEMTQFENDDDVIEPHAFDGETVLRNWNLLKTNTIFTKVSFLITAAMSLSVCNMKEIEFSIFGLKLISLEAAKQQLKAVDVIDAAINTFTWICDVGYQVYQEKSLAPLLYGDQHMRKFNDECDYVLAHSETVINGNGENLNDFEKKVDEALRKVINLKKARDGAITSSWIQDRYSKLVHVKEQIVCKRRNTAIRYAPFGVGLTGSSGVGKSTLAKLVMKTALYASGFDTDPSRIITKDMFDQYDSTYTSDILGMFMDDVGNGKAEFAKVSPTDVIIKFFNNMAAQAVKAELNSKGVVFIDFKVGVLSSNFRDYGVRHYTDKPEATLRRFIHTRVAIKDKFRKKGGVSLDTSHPDLDKGDLTQDVWNLKIEVCHIHEGKNGNDKYSFQTLTTELDGEDVVCENLDLTTYLRIIADLAAKHAHQQKRIIERSHNFDNMEMDPVTKIPMALAKVQPHAFEAIGEVIVESTLSAVNSYVASWLAPAKLLNSLMGYSPIANMATRRLSSEIGTILQETATPMIISLTPEFIFNSRIFGRAVDAWQRSAALYDMKRNVTRVTRIAVCFLLYSIYQGNYALFIWTLVLSWITAMIFWAQYRARVRVYKREFYERRDILPDSVKAMRDSKMVKGAMIVSAVAVGIKLFQLWNKNRKENIEVNAASDVDGRPGWLDFLVPKIGFKVDRQPEAQRAVSDHVKKIIHKNQFWADFIRADGSSAGCNIVFRRKSVAWFPKHMFYKNADMTNEPSPWLDVRVTRSDTPGGYFKFKVEFDTVATLDHLDMVASYVPNGPDLPDISKWLPLNKPTGTGVCAIYKRSKEDQEFRNVHVTFQEEGHSFMQFYGGRYQTSLAQKGSCMSALITIGNAPVIVGFHIGGDSNKHIGVMQTVTLDDANKMDEMLEKFDGIILSAQATELPTEQYGKPLITSTAVHEKTAFARMDKSSYIDVLGSTEIRSQQSSSVQESPISELVTEVTGQPNVWGPPKLKPNWVGYNATLEHIVNPAEMFLPSALERARKDWMGPLFPLLDEHVSTEVFRPLNDHEMVMGVAGKAFLNALPMNTGMGFPVFGKKRKHFEEVELDGVLTRIPSDEIKQELNRMIKCFENNTRAYPVTTATLKDEPTPVDKEKVRVFQASTVAFSLLIRKYFLPIARFLGCYPTVSECAAGVNSKSYDWKKLMDHAEKYAPDGKVIGWDYSKYDVRMNSQVTRAVWCSFVELAEYGGYDAYSLKIMKAMIADIVHPLIDYNGTMIMAYNMNTSGNNLTVNVNSTAGSFYVRMGFFNEYPEAEDFRSNVAALTYGDDFIGSVKDEFRAKFGFSSFKDFLAKHDMKVTLPDKSDDVQDFLSKENADFLKRQSQYIPEIDATIGKLSEMSIFKSLHSNLKSPSVSKDEVAISCLETAMDEWFAHGREVYDMRRAQMIQVCERADLPVPAVYMTFNDRVQRWKDKYARNA
nr:MAG: hypothetical protein 1 [Salisharnavirus sp.]